MCDPSLKLESKIHWYKWWCLVRRSVPLRRCGFSACFCRAKWFIRLVSEREPPREQWRILKTWLNFCLSSVLASPVPEITWKKLDGELPPNHKVEMAGAHLHLYNVQVKDGGTYQCEAANSKGKDYHSARVSVEGTQRAVGGAYLAGACQYFFDQIYQKYAQVRIRFSLW